MPSHMFEIQHSSLLMMVNGV